MLTRRNPCVCISAENTMLYTTLLRLRHKDGAHDEKGDVADGGDEVGRQDQMC